MYGHLTVVTGGMFAGKTTYLINTVSKNKDSIVFKPEMDSRYAHDECVSHDGHKVPAIPVSRPDQLIIGDSKSFICFDEVQFFHPPYYGGDIIQTIKIFLTAGKNVLVCGLDADWQGNPFPVTGALLAMADDIIKLKAKCSVCSHPAGKSYNKTRNSRDDTIVELGHGNIYEARCNRHWSPPE